MFKTKQRRTTTRSIPLVPYVSAAEQEYSTCQCLATNCRLLRIVACYELSSVTNCRLLRIVAPSFNLFLTLLKHVLRLSFQQISETYADGQSDFLKLFFQTLVQLSQDFARCDNPEELIARINKGSSGNKITASANEKGKN